MPTAVKLGMNITTSDYGRYVSVYKAEQRKKQELLAASAPRAAARGMALSSPMVGRIHNVRPGCGSCGK